DPPIVCWTPAAEGRHDDAGRACVVRNLQNGSNGNVALCRAFRADAVESSASVSIGGMGTVAAVGSIGASRPHYSIVRRVKGDLINGARLAGIKSETIVFLCTDGAIARPRPAVLVLYKSKHNAIGMVGEQQGSLIRLGEVGHLCFIVDKIPERQLRLRRHSLGCRVNPGRPDGAGNVGRMVRQFRPLTCEYP